MAVEDTSARRVEVSVADPEAAMADLAADVPRGVAAATPAADSAALDTANRENCASAMPDVVSTAFGCDSDVASSAPRPDTDRMQLA